MRSLNFIRPPRPDNMVESFSVSDEKFMDLPSLPLDDIETQEKLNWWKAKLSSLDVHARIVGLAQTELRLNA